MVGCFPYVHTTTLSLGPFFSVPAIKGNISSKVPLNPKFCPNLWHSSSFPNRKSTYGKIDLIGSNKSVTAFTLDNVKQVLTPLSCAT